MHSKDVQARFTRGRWQAGRLHFPGRGGDPADVWVVDLVVIEESEHDDLRALGRYRPARGMTPDLGPVIARAIREPVDGEPHLPAIVRVATAELAAEIRKARPDVRVVIGPTQLVETLGRELAEEVLPDPDEGEEAWSWLMDEVTVEQVQRLFAALGASVEMLLGEAFLPGQVLRVSVKELGLEPAFVHATTEEALTGGSIVSVAIAPDKRSRKAWDRDEVSDRQIDVFAIEQDELTPEAWEEVEAHDLRPSHRLFPRVTAGGEDERPPSAKEMEIAIATLEAIAAYFDPFAKDPTPSATREVTLSSGAIATVVAPPDEIIDFDDDDYPEDEDADEFMAPGEAKKARLDFLEHDTPGAWEPAPDAQPATIRAESKPGRNDPCPCGSGKKYKKCHG